MSTAQVEVSMSERLWGPARRTALALARAVLPGGTWLAAADEAVVDRAAALVAGFGVGALPGWTAGLAALEVAAAAARRGRAFSWLAPDDAARLVGEWLDGPLPQRALAQILVAPLKLAYFGDPTIYERLGATFRYRAAREHPAAWTRQILRGVDLSDDALECDAVVVGSGAGGAVVAKELAERGHAVLVLEEGELRGRADFDGRPLESVQRLYQQRGRLAAVGNCFVMIPAGRLVGGSTAVNTGTCWRTPDWVLERWVTRLGLHDLAPDRLAPCFDRVEEMLRVAVADERFMGGAARVVRRGAEALGCSHRPLRRCAPECEGAGVCDFGCPTDAKLGTNLTYLPAALKQGATLVTGTCAARVTVAGGRATGLVARVLATGRRLRVHARVTVLAGGALRTPLLLQRGGCGDGLAHAGRHLSLHPATTVSALVDDEVRGYAAMPQGYCVDHLHRDGVLILGAAAPIDMGAVELDFVGAKLMDVMEAYDRVCSLGVMIEDGPNGRVFAGPGGAILVSYWLGREEQARLLRGTALVARLFLAAGAREVWPALRGHRVVRTEADVRRLEEARPAGLDWLLAGFHPLGTCRMATSARDGVVSPDHEVFGVRDLFVADGSAVPTSTAVNPQETIMALATRAAAGIAARLDGGAA